MIEIVDLAGRTATAGALGTAAVLKLADLPGLYGTLQRSRLARPFGPYLLPALPGAELAVAGCLLLPRTAWPGCLLAAALLASFTLYLAADPGAARGCDCFGTRLRASRRRGVVRDLLLLAALAVPIARGPGAARYSVPARAELCVAAAWASAVMVCVILATRRHPRSRRTADGPLPSGRRRAGVPAQQPVATRREAPPFDLPSLAGGRLVLAELMVLRPVLLFVETGCGRCEAVLPEAAARPDVVIVAAGPAGDVACLAARYGLNPGRIALDEDGTVADAYRLPAVPGACRITADGVLADARGRPTRRLAVGEEDVLALWSGTAALSEDPKEG
jgi:uncharacterized membrane protein YphA (DoxX/SURF4 family)